MPPLLFAPLWKLLGRCRIPCSHPLLPRSFIFMSCPIIPACFSYLYHLFFLPEPVPDAHGVRHFVSAGLFILHVLFCHLLFLTSQSSVFFLRGVIYKQKSRTVAEHLSVTARLVISIFGFFVVYARVDHLFYIFCRSFDRLLGIFPVFLGVFLYVYSSCRQSYPTFHSSIFHSQKQASQAYFLCITLSSSLVSSKNPLVKLPESPNYHNQTHSL